MFVVAATSAISPPSLLPCIKSLVRKIMSRVWKYKDDVYTFNQASYHLSKKCGSHSNSHDDEAYNELLLLTEDILALNGGNKD
jgi:hypothetical protein